MKIKDIILETPYLTGPGTRNLQTLVGATKSHDSFARDYTKLGQTVNHSFWISNDRDRAYVTRLFPDDPDRNEILAVVTFENRADDLPVQNPLQVHTAYTAVVGHQNIGLMTDLYDALVKNGFTVISDFEHSDDAVGLWKGLGRKAGGRELAIHVWSDDTSDWIRDAAGQPIQYDGTNIDPAHIWHKDQSKPTSLLVCVSSR